MTQIVAWDNLLNAYHNAAKGKRRGATVAIFEHRMADHLIELRNELRDKSYRPGAYRHFVLHEHKRRKVSAAPFRDRVVHHALCNLIEPIFDARFIAHSFANRKGKGTHKAVDQFQRYAVQYRYVLRMDIVQHFPSLDHAILRTELERVIHDPDTMWLVKIILKSGVGVLANEYTPVLFAGDDLFALARPRGLPIGNLTSQFWSNVYMNPLDWFIKRELGCEAYLRYVDDFAVFSNDKTQLWEWRSAIKQRLAQMRLTMHEAEAQPVPCEHGSPWLGFVVYPNYRRVRRRNVLQFTRNFRLNLAHYAAGRVTLDRLHTSVQGWVNHVRYADTWGLRKHLFDNMPPL